MCQQPALGSSLVAANLVLWRLKVVPFGKTGPYHVRNPSEPVRMYLPRQSLSECSDRAPAVNFLAWRSLLADASLVDWTCISSGAPGQTVRLPVVRYRSTPTVCTDR